MTIFIPGNVPSSKNSKQWTGKLLISSKTTRNYIKQSWPFWIENAEKFKAAASKLSKPLSISFLFVRKSKHKFDYINPCQTVQDIMVKAGWLADDHADLLIPYFEKYLYDKDNPGVYITI